MRSCETNSSLARAAITSSCATTAGPLISVVFLYALQWLCRQLGWQLRGEHAHHRLYDLRHTFIVRSVLRLYEQGGAVEQGLPALSIYVGHAKVVDTYWYLTGIPELMTVAAERFHRYAQGKPT